MRTFIISPNYGNFILLHISNSQQIFEQVCSQQLQPICQGFGRALEDGRLDGICCRLTALGYFTLYLGVKREDFGVCWFSTIRWSSVQCRRPASPSNYSKRDGVGFLFFLMCKYLIKNQNAVFIHTDDVSLQFTNMH